MVFGPDLRFRVRLEICIPRLYVSATAIQNVFGGLRHQIINCIVNIECQLTFDSVEHGKLLSLAVLHSLRRDCARLFGFGVLPLGADRMELVWLFECIQIPTPRWPAGCQQRSDRQRPRKVPPLVRSTVAARDLPFLHPTTAVNQSSTTPRRSPLHWTPPRQRELHQPRFWKGHIRGFLARPRTRTLFAECI